MCIYYFTGFRKIVKSKVEEEDVLNILPQIETVISKIKSGFVVETVWQFIFVRY